jgi:hypothetical protein
LPPVTSKAEEGMLSLGGCPDVQTAYHDAVALARQQEAQREQDREVKKEQWRRLRSINHKIPLRKKAPDDVPTL